MISISASDYQNNLSTIRIHEELPPNTLLYTSVSSSNILQWLPSSYAFQSSFTLAPNQSLYTTDQSIDREAFCEKKFCNCSECRINLNFLQTFSTNNISVRTIQVVVEGREKAHLSPPIIIFFRRQRSLSHLQAITDQTSDRGKRSNQLRNPSRTCHRP